MRKTLSNDKDQTRQWAIKHLRPYLLSQPVSLWQEQPKNYQMLDEMAERIVREQIQEYAMA